MGNSVLEDIKKYCKINNKKIAKEYLAFLFLFVGNIFWWQIFANAFLFKGGEAYYWSLFKNDIFYWIILNCIFYVLFLFVHSLSWSIRSLQSSRKIKVNLSHSQDREDKGAKPTSADAIISSFFALLGVFGMPAFGLVAFVFGTFALKKIKLGKYRGLTLAYFGLIIGAIESLFFIIPIWFWFMNWILEAIR